MKYKTVLFCLVIIVISITVVLKLFDYIKARRYDQTNQSGKIQVTTSIYPLYFFTQAIGGDYLTVSLIVPTGAEPHEYEPTPQQRATMEKSALLIVNGAKLEPWGEKVSRELQTKGVKVLSVADHMELRELNADGGIKDPHMWLSPHYARKETEQILQSLIEIDPKNKNYYTQNAQVLFAQFDQLDGQFHEGLEQCQTRDFVTSHAAFGYLADEYGLQQIPIQISPDAEPSAAGIAGIIEFSRSHAVQYVFFESLVSPKLSETIAKEIGAKTLVLDPVEGIAENDMVNGKNYFSIMKNNLNNLRTALQCN